MLVPPELILNKPDGIINANVTYKENDKKNLDFKFDVSQIKWSDIMLRRLTVRVTLSPTLQVYRKAISLPNSMILQQLLWNSA